MTMLSVNSSGSVSASAGTRMSMCLSTRTYEEYERERDSKVEPDEKFEYHAMMLLLSHER
jgi:hypothetical protein